VRKWSERRRTHWHLEERAGVLADGAGRTATCGTTDRAITDLRFGTASLDQFLADPKRMVECAAMTTRAILSADLRVIQPVEAGKATRPVKTDPAVLRAAAESPGIVHPARQLNSLSVRNWQSIRES
jgi:hypothetical protein